MILLVLITIIIALFIYLLYKFINNYDEKKERILDMVVKGDIAPSYLKSANKPQLFSVIYRTDGGLETFRTEATNKFEAQYQFFIETGFSLIKVLRVTKL